MNIRKLKFKILTFSLALFASQVLHAVVNQEQFKTHLRWSVQVPRNQVLISKAGTRFYIETLDLKTFNDLKVSLGNINMNNKYFSKINYSEDGFPEKPARITVEFANNAIELFSFYQNTSRQHILDFWINEENINETVSAAENRPIVATPTPRRAAPTPAPKVEVKAPVVVEKKVEKPVQKKTKDLLKDQLPKTTSSSKLISVKNNDNYRDFRYGAAFLWDYAPLAPSLKSQVLISRKTPEFFYPIKDRKFDKDDKEAHLQLTINLYRKEKWGLMNKSITLYEKKYGIDKNKAINDYIKANAIIRENINRTDRGPFKMATNLLTNVYERSDDYELKRAILTYLNQYEIENKNFIESLRLSKKLYIFSKKDFDRETTNYAAQSILYSLAMLGQINKIEKFINEQNIIKLLPQQIRLAYEIFAQIKLGKIDESIEDFKKNEAGLTQPIEASILFNIAEAYFRKSKYNEAIKYFDEFLDKYSYMYNSGKARTRIALSYEMLSKDIDKTIQLYKNAINRSTDPSARFEAKLRYVALRTIRKLKPSKEDSEVRVFLESSPDEKKIIDGDIKHLLWLVRLRTLINDERFTDGLTYLSTLPLNALTPTKRRVFQGDGAEIVYGLVKKSYEKQNYSKVVKLWEIYRTVYNDKVAMDPYINFLVSHSYLKLGLSESFQRTVEFFEKIKDNPVRTFPLWVDRVSVSDSASLIKELDLLKKIDRKQWDQAGVAVDQISEDNLKKYYYKSIIEFSRSNFQEVIKNVETFLSRSGQNLPLNKAEIYTLFGQYVESIYNLGDVEKFEQTAQALLSDINKVSDKDEKLQMLREKINYLSIEILFGKGRNEDFVLLEPRTKEFLKNFDKSFYKNRVEYLLGITLSKLNKNAEAMKVLQDLLNNNDMPDYIKEMSRAEISSLKLKEKNI